MMDALVRRQSGEQDDSVSVDWKAVYAEYLPRVYNYFRFRTGDNALAEDLTAQTFERAWRERARYRRERGTCAAWLFTIARNVAANHFRRPDERNVSLESAHMQRDQQSRDQQPLEELIQQHNDLARLDALLANLSPRDRELIELKYSAMLTNREIARLTGLSESNVGTILHRAVKQLRGQWEET